MHVTANSGGPTHRITGIALLAGCLIASAGRADDRATYFPQRISAADLLKACASSALSGTGRERRRYCYGFVSGVEEGVRLVRSPATATGRLCVPPDASSRDLAEAFTAYAARPGTDLSQPAASVALAALEQAFPCR